MRKRNGFPTIVLEVGAELLFTIPLSLAVCLASPDGAESYLWLQEKREKKDGKFIIIMLENNNSVTQIEQKASFEDEQEGSRKKKRKLRYGKIKFYSICPPSDGMLLFL